MDCTALRISKAKAVMPTLTFDQVTLYELRDAAIPQASCMYIFHYIYIHVLCTVHYIGDMDDFGLSQTDLFILSLYLFLFIYLYSYIVFVSGFINSN